MGRGTTSMAVEERLPSGTYTWRTKSYSKKMNETKFYSEESIVAFCSWRLLIYPNGYGKRATSHLSVYLDASDAATLPKGWSRDAAFSLTLVNEHDLASVTDEKRRTFNSGTVNWGFPGFISLTKLQDPAEGYLVNDALVIKVDITLHKVVPPVKIETHLSRLSSCCTDLSNSFGAGVGTSHLKETPDSASGTLSPSKDDIMNAKQSLKECPSDHFNLNMRDKLSSALSILCHSSSELSQDQRNSIETFRANFDSFLLDCLAHEREITDLKLQKIKMDKVSSALKKTCKTNLSLGESIDTLTKEENDLEKKLKEVNAKKRNLTYEWDTSISEAEDLKSQLIIQEQKLEEAKKRNKTVEETMSRTNSPWSSLKKHFL